jgi:hypothetical protein
MSETQPLLGTIKTVRAIRDVVYKGTAYRGRKRERVDEKNRGYYFIETHPGDQFTCDALFAKQAENNGEIVLLSGGRVTVTEQKDGFHTYQSWIKNASDPDPVYERCELLSPLFLGDGCHLPTGTKIRIDVRVYDRSQYFFSDETQNYQHRIRVLAASPKRTRLNAVEQAGKVNALFDKFFPATAQNAL